MVKGQEVQNGWVRSACSTDAKELTGTLQAVGSQWKLYVHMSDMIITATAYKVLCVGWDSPLEYFCNYNEKAKWVNYFTRLEFLQKVNLSFSFSDHYVCMGLYHFRILGGDYLDFSLKVKENHFSE